MKIISNMLAVINIILLISTFIAAVICTKPVVLVVGLTYIVECLIYLYIEVNREDGDKDGKDY